jgi:hypothetical protein
MVLTEWAAISSLGGPHIFLVGCIAQPQHCGGVLLLSIEFNLGTFA